MQYKLIQWYKYIIILLYNILMILFCNDMQCNINDYCVCIVNYCVYSIVMWLFYREMSDTMTVLYYYSINAISIEMINILLLLIYQYNII